MCTGEYPLATELHFSLSLVLVLKYCKYYYCFILLGYSTDGEPTDWQNKRRVTKPRS